jgi:hypothetical protein
VVAVHAHKRLAELGETTGVMIHIEPVVEPFPLHKIADQIPVDRSWVNSGASLPSVPVSHVE